MLTQCGYGSAPGVQEELLGLVQDTTGRRTSSRHTTLHSNLHSSRDSISNPKSKDPKLHPSNDLKSESKCLRRNFQKSTDLKPLPSTQEDDFRKKRHVKKRRFVACDGGSEAWNKNDYMGRVYVCFQCDKRFIYRNTRGNVI